MLAANGRGKRGRSEAHQTPATGATSSWTMAAVMRRKMLVVSDTAECAAVVRRQLAQTLSDWECPDELVGDAKVVATELVTNAMLHGGGCTSLAAVFDGRSLRLEVGDRDRVPPQPYHYDDVAATGRGLRLVAGMSASWGWETQAAGKIVWAELGRPLGGEPGAEDAGVERPSRHTVDEVLVRFRDVPIATFLTLQEQNDAIHRDVDLVLIGREEGLTSEVPEDLLQLVHEMRTRFGRPTSRHRAAVESAGREGRTTVDLEEWVSPTGVASSYQYVKLLEQIEAYAGRGHLLVGRPGQATVQLRRWFSDQVAAQVSGAQNVWP
jgi:anti-sigma regulatory factor (Ser/Thr protein kinase)